MERPSGSGGDSAAQPIALGGVYVAIPRRLVAGSLYNAQTCATADPGALLITDLPLPPLSQRYFISCIPHQTPQPSTNKRNDEAKGGATAAGTTSESNALSPASSTSPTKGTPLPSASHPGATPTVALTSDEPRPTEALVAQMNRNAADFLAKMMERRRTSGLFGAQLPSGVSVPTTAAGTEAATSTTTTSSALRAPGSLASDARSKKAEEERELRADSAKLRAKVEKEMGDEHFLLCDFTSMSEEQLTRFETAPPVQSAMRFISKALTASPDSLVYIYSPHGRNSASALAMLYLVQHEHVPMQEVVTRLPLSAPRVPLLMALLRLSDASGGGAGFDEKAYFLSYFSRRYPERSLLDIQAALETFPGDYKAMDRVLQEQHLVHVTSAKTAQIVEAQIQMGYLPINASGSFEPLPGLDVQASMASANASFPSTGAAAGGGGGGGHGSPGPQGSTSSGAGSPREGNPGSPSSLSFASSSGVIGAGPIVLTDVDRETIASLHRALSKSKTAVSLEEVEESFVRNRRNKDKVLREMLYKDTPSPIEALRAVLANRTVPSPKEEEVSAVIEMPGGGGEGEKNKKQQQQETREPSPPPRPAK